MYHDKDEADEGRFLGPLETSTSLKQLSLHRTLASSNELSPSSNTTATSPHSKHVMDVGETCAHNAGEKTSDMG